MDYDNPAARLFLILQKGKTYSGTDACRGIWAKLLNTDDSATLIMRLGKLMSLPKQIIQELKDNYPTQENSWEYWEERVNKAFMSQNLNATWASFIDHIDHHTITYIKMSADLLQQKSKCNIISNKNLDDIKCSIDIIYNKVLECKIEDDIKRYLIYYINKMINSIDEYEITGATPIIESVDVMIGHTHLDKNYRSFMVDTELGKEILNTLAAAANIVTVAVGIPQIANAIKLLT